MDEPQELNPLETNEKTSDFHMEEKIYEMLIYANGFLDKFPRIERYCLAQDIRKQIYLIYRLVIKLENKHYKKTTLNDLDDELDLLRRMIRMAADKNLHKGMAPCISTKNYHVMSGYMTEIGKMIGGYFNSLNPEKTKKNQGRR